VVGVAVNEQYNDAALTRPEECVLVRCSTKFWVVICLCLSASVDIRAQASSVPLATVEHADVTLTPNGLTIEIALSAPFLPQGMPVTNPDRLVFDFPGFTLPAGNRQMPINNGPVRRFRAALFQSDPPITRIVVDLKEPVNFDVKSVGNKVVIEIPFSKASSVPAASAPPSASIEKKAEKKKDQATLDRRADTPSQPVIAVPNQLSSASAYKLQDKAKDLRLEDLQSLEEKSDAGDPEAETLLALALHSGTLLRRDDAEALRLLRKAADQGSMAAQESLGIFSAMGIGMEQPAPTEALEWYKKAAQQGSLDAATNIGLMYADGIGVPKDPAQAMIWFRKAAEGGDATAQYNLALTYGRGKEVPQDYKEAVRWLTAAADQKVVPATLDLAAFYLHPPDGTPADVARSIHYYEKAAALGSVPAEVTLGNIFANGAQGKPDYEKAVTWYSKAADQGQPDAQFGLALRYALGQGVPVDLEEALRLFIAAANQGQAGAQFNLATMYEEGKGIPADRALAVHYYQLSAEQGMPKAQFRLGRLLADNKESRSDQVSAYKWLMLAENSIKESSAILSDLRKSMNQEEINEAEREVDSWRIAHPESQHR
jgi:TPR repeat protein